MPKILPLRSAQTIAVLAVTQIISWGTTFDMLGVMGRIVAPELDLPNEVVFFGLSIMMLVSALAGPATGRLLGRHGAAKVMAGASVIFAVGLLLLASAHEILVYGLAWIVIGIGGALGLSAPAYTAVVEREGLDGKRIIAILMLFTGLSATIFWPLLALMNDLVGWRMTFVFSAMLQLFICLPLYLFGLPEPIDRNEQTQATDTVPVDFTPPERRRAFFLVAAATAISSFISFGLSPSLLALLQQAGASPALALQLGSARGAIGVSARFVDMALGRRGNALLTSLVGTGLVLFSFLLAATVTSSAPGPGGLHAALWLRHRRARGRPRAPAAVALLAARIRPAIGPPVAAAEPCQCRRPGHLHRPPRPRRRHGGAGDRRRALGNLAGIGADAGGAGAQRECAGGRLAAD
jgi:MFS family permease